MAADRSAALSLSDGMSHWKNEWKPIIDMLLMFIHHPKRIKSHLRITIDVIASNLDEKVELFCPDRGREADEMMFRSYKDFLSAITNCFLIMLSKDLDFSKAPGISSFYRKLMLKLFHNCGSLFVYLMDKFMSSLSNVLDVYANSMEFHPPISLGTFAVAQSNYIPEECRNLVRLNGLVGSKSTVSFLTDVIFNCYETVMQSPLSDRLLQITMKRLEAWDFFNHSDLITNNFLLAFPFHNYVEFLPRLAEISSEILSKTNLEKQSNHFNILKDHISRLFLKPDIPLQRLSSLLFPQKLKASVLRQCDGLKDETSLAMSQLLCKLLRLDIVELTEIEIKWLAHRFSGESEVAGEILLAFLETELRRALPLLQTLSSSSSNQPCKGQTKKSRNWHNAEDYCKVWQILQCFFHRKLDKLVQVDEQNAKKPLIGIKKLHLILNGLQIASNRLEHEQNNSLEALGLVSFCFFPVTLGKLIAQMGVLPNHCIENMPLKSGGASRDECQRSIESWRQVLEMLNILRMLPESHKLEQADLNSIELLCGLPWLHKNDKVDVPKSKLQWYQHLAEILQRKLQGDVTESYSINLLLLFCVEFNKTKSRPSAWRVCVIGKCLATLSGENLDIFFKSLPVVIASCQRTDIQVVFSAFMKTKTKTAEILVSVAEILPAIVCSLSGCCEVHEIVSGDELPKIEVKMLCSECNKNKQLSGPKGWNFLNLLGKFTDDWGFLATHPSSDIKKIVVAGFPQIIKHIGTTFKQKDLKVWLKLLSDKEPKLATAFAANLDAIMGLSNDPDIKEETQNLILIEIDNLIGITWRQKSSWDPIFVTLNLLLQTQETSLVRPVVRLIIKLVTLKTEDLCGINQLVVDNFFRCNQMSPMVVFYQYQDVNWRTILETMDLQEPHERNVIHCFNRICNIFNFKSSDVLKKHLYRFLQVLIPKCVVDSNYLYVLKDTAQYLSTSQQSMLFKWHSMLYPFFVVNHPQCLDFYLKMAGCDDDIDRFFTLIIIQVVLNFHGNAADIYDKLSNILKESDDKPSVSPDDVSDHMQTHLLGVLEYIQSNVLNKYASSELKMKSLVGFSSMLGLLKKEAVSPFHGKILDALCTFKNLEEPKLVQAYCELVLSFLNNLEDDKISGVMFTIMTNVTFLSKDKYYNNAKAIMDFFLTSHRKQHIKPHGKDLLNLMFLLEEYEYTSILDSCRQHAKSLSVDNMLEVKLEAITNNYVESQIVALKELKRYLKTVQPQIQEILFKHSREYPSLNQIIGKLISGSSSLNSSVRLLSIECLSQLGAIDPGHWIISGGFKDKSKFFFDSSCADFVCRALETLLDGFQASTNKANMDIIGFVCQEFMKANDFQDQPAKAPVQIWNQFSEQTKTTLIPFFTSTYIAKLNVDAEDFPHPLCGSNVGQTFEDWVFVWVIRLISMIKCKSTRDMLDALKLVFKINLKDVNFFLPHIFTHAIWSASAANLEQILDEMVLAAKLYENPRKISDEESLEVVFQALGLTFDLQSFVDCHTKDVNNAQNEMGLKCAKIVFFLIDYLIHWNFEYEQAHQGGSTAKSRSSRDSSYSDSSRDYRNSALAHKYRINKEFLEKFNLKVAAEQSHACNENFRSLRYLEMHCLKHKESIEECASLLLQIHSQLQNSDFVHGISSIQKGSTARYEQLLLYEMNGQSQESIIWYEKMLANGEGDPHEIICNMAKAHLHLEQYQPVLGIVTKYSAQTQNSKFKNALGATKLEAHWRMGAWEHLEKTLKELPQNEQTWAYMFAKILISIFNCHLEETNRNILEMRVALGEWLSKCGANSSSYANNYPTFLLMHLLADVVIVVELLHPSVELGSLSSKEQISKITCAIAEIESRQRRICFAWKGLQMVFAVRRTLLSLLQHVLAGFEETDAYLRRQMGLLWLESAKIAINERQFPQALGYTISGEQCGLKETFLLQAQLEWESGAKERALIYLHRGIEKYFPDCATFVQMAAGVRVEDRKICAKAKLMIAEYSTKMKIVDTRNSVSLYKDAKNCYQYWEESFVHLARAWDILKQNKEMVFNENQNINVLNEIVRSYTSALSNGVKHLYESLPRVITIWANTGGKLHEIMTSGKSDKTRKDMMMVSFNNFNDNLKNLMRRLPPYAFYACFNSLSSRLCHPYKPVYTMIKEIFINLLKAFPYQMLWKLVPMLKVSQIVRVNRVQEILLAFAQQNSDMNILMNDYLKLCTFLYDLGHFQPKGNSSRARMSVLKPELVEFIRNPKTSKILMPTDELLSVVLPADDSKDYKNHNAFPKEQVFITRVLDPVTIIASLQKPKKFTLCGSNDREYSWLVKNKDDLRIDASVMHFMQVLNSLMDKDTECRERRLNCKTYCVVPLGEDCGLIEFIPNLITLRQVIMNLYKGKGERNEAQEELRKNDTVEQKKKVFETALIPAHPPVLSDWFHWKFSDHSAWNEARKKFITSTAVMSVVGYILGLGDRHGGNIMLCQTTGESIHVDYNCVFNKGETLPWPEKVPFRLTHNMITAMGVAGIEGPYRKAAELTLKVMRLNSETLISVLRPIMFDATAKDRQTEKSSNVEFINKSVVSSLKRVQLRLAGYLNDTTNEELTAMSLSPEGHAKAIIRQASDINNLCQMYPGWGAFL